jgi:hypothetical protein
LNDTHLRVILANPKYRKMHFFLDKSSAYIGKRESRNKHPDHGAGGEILLLRRKERVHWL